MTVAGQHTISEARYFLLESNSQIQQLNRGYEKEKDRWAKSEPEKQAAFDTDWKAFLKRWNPFFVEMNTKLQAQSSLLPGVPDTMIPAETEYQQIKSKLRQHTDRHDPQDFNVLVNRMAEANLDIPVKKGDPNSNILNMDVDQLIYKQSDAMIKQIESKGPPLLLLGLAGVGAYLFLTRRK